MPKLHPVAVSRSDRPFEIDEREILQPAPREVQVKVYACGLYQHDAGATGSR